jgi:hypothetical protein
MNTRWFILLLALFGVSCRSNMNSSLVVTKMVLGTVTTVAGPPAYTYCSYDPGGTEFDFAQIDPTANSGGTMGVVVENNLTDTSTLNGILRTNSATFHPHQVVADYQETQPGGITVTQQIIPTTGTVPAGGTGAVLVPFFAPIPATLLTGIIRVTFHIEGVLDDGSNVRTSEREYIFVTCSGSACNSACL